MWDVWIEFFVTLWNLIKIFFSLFILILNPILYLLKFVLFNIMNFISLLISSIIYLVYLFGMLVKSLSEYLQFIPLMIRNILKFFNIIINYIIYIYAIILSFLAWFFGFAENGNEDEFF